MKVYIKEIDYFSNEELKKKIESIFYGEVLNLSEFLFFKYFEKYKKKIFLDSEFKCFFECFMKIKNQKLEKDINSFKYFLLCLNSDNKIINIMESDLDIVSEIKIEKYRKYLEKLK